jgi:CDP-diacylglycerol--glycerol-3-phosphate 3-phosphatidyltransferase
MEHDRVAAPALDLRWTLSNALSALRMVLVLPMAYTLIAGMRWATVVICVLAAVTDVLDGYIARRNNEISDLGKILDPLADKVFVGVLVILLLIKAMLPLWFVAVVLGRDLLILAGGLLVERRTGAVLPSNYPGKIAVLVLSTTLLLIIIGTAPIVITVMMTASLVLLAISLVLYATRAIEAGRGKGRRMKAEG